MARTTVKVWTDGACIGNPGPGGWAYKFEDADVVSGYYSNTTNNNMEMIAVLHALEDCPPETTMQVVTDSQLVIGWLSGRYRCNLPHIQAVRNTIDDLCIMKSIILKFELVKGHSSDRNNIICDRAANAQARKLSNIELSRQRR